ncbi:hypothetical protein KIN20_019468 [Parelaphostrongylus tenuis]|uniref:Uncharacterized protein n=1 Tax=Parelaphostrongylus tenuis TaxID=148309 RepID=A0AAD5ML42_PARTN|nr:hypothetical protein KIN20_019468 [Parelaphostrongylus tenuis]
MTTLYKMRCTRGQPSHLGNRDESASRPLTRQARQDVRSAEEVRGSIKNGKVGTELIPRHSRNWRIHENFFLTDSFHASPFSLENLT